MFYDIRTDLIGSHAHALMTARVRSLEAYGINPNGLMKYREHRELVSTENQHRELMKLDEVRSLSKVTKESRALAIQEDHNLPSLI